jgi:Family of unknown function (DUF6455)
VTDFCYSGPMFKRVLDQADLMDRVMEVVGVVAARAARLDRGKAWYEARCRCIACPDDGRCRAWLAGLGVSQTACPPAFCRNTEFFRLAKGSTGQHQMQDRHERSPAELEETLAPRHV